MGSINPVFVLPGAVRARGDEIAKEFAQSMSMAGGQFCTSPGLLVTLKEHLTDKVANHLSQTSPDTMLNPNIAKKYKKDILQRSENPAITVLSDDYEANTGMQPKPCLMKTSGDKFISSPELMNEIFGPTSLVVECDSINQLLKVAEHLEGNLTATIHTDHQEQQDVKALLDILVEKAGRVLFNGYPTGVEVCPSMHHGGPYPASSMPFATSVGTRSITRFVKRSCFQNCPDDLLPVELKNSNPMNIWRLLDSNITKDSISTQDQITL